MTRDVPTRGELLHNFVQISFFAIKRTASYRDLPFLLLVLVAPVLHLLKFRGELKTPMGRFLIQSNNILRWTVYGVFKTRFYYLRMLKSAKFKDLPCSIVLDVGANLGDFTMGISSEAEKIIAVEPGRENFALLCSNLRFNSVDQVIPLNMAAHDSVEDLSLIGNGGDLRVSEFNGGEHTTGVRLDDVLQTHKIGRVDVLKIDVQGHEMKVLQGMSGSLKRHSAGLVIVEIHPQRDVNGIDIINFMQKFGYHVIATDYLIGNRPQLYFE